MEDREVQTEARRLLSTVNCLSAIQFTSNHYTAKKKEPPEDLPNKAAGFEEKTVGGGVSDSSDTHQSASEYVPFFVLIDESEEITSRKGHRDGLPNSNHTKAAITNGEHDVDLCTERVEACPYYEGSVDRDVDMGMAGSKLTKSSKLSS